MDGLHRAYGFGRLFLRFLALKFLVPATPLSNGIDTFCMNTGMMIWFAYLLVKKA